MANAFEYSWIVKIGTYINDVFSVIWKSKAIQDSLPKKKIKYIKRLFFVYLVENVL